MITTVARAFRGARDKAPPIWSPPIGRWRRRRARTRNEGRRRETQTPGPEARRRLQDTPPPRRRWRAPQKARGAVGLKSKVSKVAAENVTEMSRANMKIASNCGKSEPFIRGGAERQKLGATNPHKGLALSAVHSHVSMSLPFAPSASSILRESPLSAGQGARSHNRWSLEGGATGGVP